MLNTATAASINPAVIISEVIIGIVNSDICAMPESSSMFFDVKTRGLWLAICDGILTSDKIPDTTKKKTIPEKACLNNTHPKTSMLRYINPIIHKASAANIV